MLSLDVNFDSSYNCISRINYERSTCRNCTCDLSQFYVCACFVFTLTNNCISILTDFSVKRHCEYSCICTLDVEYNLSFVSCGNKYECRVVSTISTCPSYETTVCRTGLCISKVLIAQNKVECSFITCVTQTDISGFCTIKYEATEVLLVVTHVETGINVLQGDSVTFATLEDPDSVSMILDIAFILVAPTETCIHISVSACRLSVNIACKWRASSTFFLISTRLAHDIVDTILRQDQFSVECFISIVKIFHCLVVCLEQECTSSNSFCISNSCIQICNSTCLEVTRIFAFNSRFSECLKISNLFIQLSLVGEYRHVSFVSFFQGINGCLCSLTSSNLAFSSYKTVFELSDNSGIHVCIYAIGIVFSFVNTELRKVPVCVAIKYTTMTVVLNFIEVSINREADIPISLRHFDREETGTLHHRFISRRIVYLNCTTFGIQRSILPCKCELTKAIPLFRRNKDRIFTIWC